MGNRNGNEEVGWVRMQCPKMEVWLGKDRKIGGQWQVECSIDTHFHSPLQSLLSPCLSLTLPENRERDAWSFETPFS